MQFGSELLLEMREHRLEKNKLKSSAFSLKSVMKQLLEYKGGMRGIFLLFKSNFITDQYALAFFWVSFNLFAILL